MDNSFNIQLAIQGGGAKLAALIASMEAIEKLQNERLLKVTRIAGTSAGSLAGCLFAAGIPMDKVRILLKGDMGKRLLDHFTMPSWLAIGKRIYMNQPFWDQRVLERELATIFEEENVHQLSDLKAKSGIEMFVVAANLGDAQKHVHKDTDNLVSAIVDSCGLPYCFRVWNKNGNPVMVDGGICENLPIDELIREENQYGPVIAISFDKLRSYAPRNIKEFSMALLDTAMNNSITRAKSLLPQRRVFPIQTSIQTFDFTKALNEGLDTEYKLIKLQAEQWFRDLIQRELLEKENEHIDIQGPKPASPRDPWVEENATVTDIMRKLGQVYRDQHANSKFEHLHCSFQIQANCLLSEDDPNFGRPDLMKYSAKFKPSSEAIYCMSVSLGDAEETQYLRRHRWDVWDDKNNAVAYVSVPVRDPEHPKERKQLIFFVPQLKPDSGTYELLFQDEALGFMKPLAVDKRDVLGICPSRVLGTVGRVDLVLHVPEPINARMVPQAKMPIQGRQMTKAELKAFPPPPGFQSLGWTGENLALSECFAVDVYI